MLKIKTKSNSFPVLPIDTSVPLYDPTSHGIQKLGLKLHYTASSSQSIILHLQKHKGFIGYLKFTTYTLRLSRHKTEARVIFRVTHHHYNLIAKTAAFFKTSTYQLGTYTLLLVGW